MHTQTKKTTVTFARPFQLEGLEAIQPAGVYNVESEDDVLDDMFLPDCLRTSVLIHLHATPDSPGFAQTLAVHWAVLEAALSKDRSPAAVIPTEQCLEEMLLDPAIQLLMRSDGVSEAHVRDLISKLSKRNLSHDKAK